MDKTAFTIFAALMALAFSSLLNCNASYIEEEISNYNYVSRNGVYEYIPQYAVSLDQELQSIRAELDMAGTSRVNAETVASWDETGIYDPNVRIVLLKPGDYRRLGES